MVDQQDKSPEAAMKRLYESISSRWRPEDVAADILIILQQPTLEIEDSLIQLVSKAAQNSLEKQMYHYTSMSQRFFEAIPPERQCKTSQVLFEPVLDRVVQCDNFRDPEKVLEYVRSLGTTIAKEFNQSQTHLQRLNRQQRESLGISWCKRKRYNKCFNYLKHLEQKILRYINNLKKFSYMRISKSGLSEFISQEEFFQDQKTACFCAYMVAKQNMRSQFALKQESRFDEIAQGLYNMCLEHRNTNWYIIAQVFLSSRVLQHLTEEQKSLLLGKWTEYLKDIAGFLEIIEKDTAVNTSTMVVKKGNNSSDWNAAAGAWNKVRTNWITLLINLGLDQVLETHCPGKVLRLMAADLMRWHQSEGEEIHPDTLVWRELPKPWEVFLHDVPCPKSLVEELCARAKLDPYKSGWTGIKEDRKAVQYRPTPELVHGVTVSSPYLASILKKAGCFSGYKY